MSNDTATTVGDWGGVAENDLCLLVIGPSSQTVLPLPSTGEIVIGRSRKCQVHISDPMASRRHAILRLGTSATVEDLKSANGTRLLGAFLTAGVPVPVAQGEAIRIGSTVLLLEGIQRATLEQRHFLPREDFKRRVNDACLRAETGSGRFAYARIELERRPCWPVVVSRLARTLKTPHVFTAVGLDAFELLLLEPDEVRTTELLDIVQDGLKALAVRSRIAVVWCPDDGTSAAALAERARAALCPDVHAPAGKTSNEMDRAHELVARAAPSRISVLLLGETGVGKEVMAATIHRLSPRSQRPFVTLNCAGLTETLIESELFGHQKGAFTGAVQAKKGLLETGDGGTVFLDEIGEMPLGIQARLLRVLEQREVLPVGALAPRKIDVRFIAATNNNLERAVRLGTFRRDLYFRLNGITIAIPPLRHRRAEILPLARAFVASAAKAAGRSIPELSSQTADILVQYQWPGNVRELKNVMERAVVLSDGDSILPDALLVERPGPASSAHADKDDAGQSRRLTPEEESERQRMINALELNVWNQSKAAKFLGMPRRTFTAKLGRYGIPRPKKNPLSSALQSHAGSAISADPAD